MSTLTLLTYYTTDREDYQKLADLIIPERDAYCARHGYRHLVFKGPYKDPALYYAIQRLWYLLDDMEGAAGTDLYWVLNLQSVLTNHTIGVADYVKDNGDKHFWITRDVNGLNAGSFIVRNSPEGRQFVRFVAGAAPHVGHCWHEQQVIIQNETNPRYAPIISVLPQETINAYWYQYYKWPDTTPGQWKPGSLALSLPGMNLSERLGYVPEWSAKTVK